MAEEAHTTICKRNSIVNQLSQIPDRYIKQTVIMKTN